MLSLLTLALTIAILAHAAAAETFETVFATQPGGIWRFWIGEREGETGITAYLANGGALEHAHHKTL
jgi:hypothetical protein